MAQQDFITGPFGSAVAVPAVEVPAPGINGTGTPMQDGPRVPLTDATAAPGSPRVAASREVRTDRAQREDSSILEGIGGAINTWDTTRLIKRMSRPTFDGDTPINQFDYLENVPEQLDADEHEFFKDVAHGQKSAAYAMDVIRDRRMALRVAGDHPVAGLATQFLDPLWLAVPPAVRAGKLSRAAGRVVSAGVSGAVGAGVIAAGEGPVSDTEIALGLMMNATLGAVLYKPGKGLVNADPDLPTALSEDIAKSITTANAEPMRKFVSPSEWEDVQIPLAGDEIAGHKRTDLGDVILTPSAKEPGKFQITFFDGAAGKSKTVADQVFDTADEAVKAFDETAGEIIKRTWTGEGVPTRSERRMTKEAVWEDIPPELSPGAVRTDPAAVVSAVDTVLQGDAKRRGIGERIMWNMHKTMQGYGAAGRKIADLLYDNNSNLSITSVEAHREAILSDLRRTQFEYEDMMRAQMAAQGYGTMKMVNPFTSREAYAVQAGIEREVQRELFRREAMANQGMPIRSESVPKQISDMADKLDDLHKRALSEMKAAGIEGAENLLERPGYLNRKWNSTMIDDVIERLKAQGLTHEKAHAQVVDLVANSLRRANRMDEATSKQVGGAIVDRALRKGYFEDSAFNSPAGTAQLAELRDILRESGMSAPDIERALSVLRVAQDEAGKAGFMKHRMDLDYNTSIRIGQDNISVADLIDGRVSSIVDQYIQRVATNTAFARKGLRKRSDIDALRDELMQDVPREKRDEARRLFDNTLAHYRGEPAGAAISDNFRLYQTYGRSISLAWSGLWQMTEYATAMGEYGLRKTLKYAMQEMPGFKQLMQPDKATAHSLQNILAEHSSMSMRLRPYIARFEDGYEMDTGSALQLSAQKAGQLVPYANAMRYVHHHQAKVVGNLILDRVEMAAKGNAKARQALQMYGIEAPVMDKLAAEIAAKGLNVDAWDDAVWASVRPAFAKMMDASVLKGRLGDVPAFAAFDPIGKFIFTYRTFVLTAHNKVLAGMLERNGAGAVGLVLMYQLPLAMAAVQAQSVVSGKGTLSEDEIVQKALGQMGGMGLFSEPLKWASGQSNTIGAPGLIPIDRAIQLFQAGTNLDPEKGGSAALGMLPVISAVPFMRGIQQQIKE